MLLLADLSVDDLSPGRANQINLVNKFSHKPANSCLYIITRVIMWGRGKNFQVLMMYELRNPQKYISLSQSFFYYVIVIPTSYGLFPT